MVVPAHDEAAVIEHCLRSLLEGASPGEFEVVVVANGCTDDTASLARSVGEQLGQRVVVLELEEASKAAALRAADRATGTFPRVYLDADVVCGARTVRALAAALQSPGVDLAVPGRELDLSAAGRGSRLYYSTWARSSKVQGMLAGRGCYALSARGRLLIGPFPDQVADDRFVTTAVPRSAARVVPDSVRISPPGDLRTVLAVRERVYAGNLQLGAVPYGEPRPAGRRVLDLLGPPSGWPGFVVYAAVTCLAKVRARAAVQRGGVRWGRDAARGAGQDRPPVPEGTAGPVPPGPGRTAGADRLVGDSAAGRP